MKKSKLHANILSNGSLIFTTLSLYESKKTLGVQKLDLLNHPVWTGRRPKDQTEISSFISKLDKGRHKVD